MAAQIEYREIGISVSSCDGSDTTKDTLSFVSPRTSERVSLVCDLSYQPQKVLAGAVSLGIKQNIRPDFTAVMLPKGSSCAAVFTKSLCPSATVLRNRRLLPKRTFRVLAVNSGNANVFTPTGEQDLEQTAQLLATELSVAPDDVLISSTGVIGIPLPMEKFVRGIPGLKLKLREGNLAATAEAILTTDVAPKIASVKCGEVLLCGMVKGAGMIEPNMATMLAYLFTNARIGPLAQTLLEEAVGLTFNRISVDTDTSTSDTVALFSTEEVELDAKAVAEFQLALCALCLKLARDVVSQGEGVTKIIEVAVFTEQPIATAEKLAKQIVNSPLIKCAIHGADPNWGRIVMALGKPIPGQHEALIDPAALRIDVQGTTVYRNGELVGVELAEVSRRMRDSRVVQIEVKLGRGTNLGRAWGCDLSKEYVRINAEYMT